MGGQGRRAEDALISRIELGAPGQWRPAGAGWRAADSFGDSVGRLAAHLDVVGPAGALGWAGPLLAAAAADSPASVIDLYLRCDEAPAPEALRAWRLALPHAPGYLDRVAVYASPPGPDGGPPDPDHGRVSPRIFLVLPWSAAAEPSDYAGAAELIWRFSPAVGEPLPLGAWRVAGGAGISLELCPDTPADERAALLAEARAWAAEQGRVIWA